MLPRIKILFLFLISIGIFSTIYAQSSHFGLPGVRNFSRSEYSGGLQTWSVGETDNGLQYFANNSGLLEFNGSNWTLYGAIHAINRSLCVDGNRVYVGAYNEFGFYEENERGTMKYHSLVHLLKEKIGDFDEIWRIYKTSFGIVFQSFKAIFIYQNGKIDIVYPPSKFHLSYYVNETLWAFDEEKGLMRFSKNKFTIAIGSDYLIGKQIWAILPYKNNEVLIATSKNGVFWYNGINIKPWNSEMNVQLKKYQIYCGIVLKNNYFAFGTIQNGLIVTDSEGRLVMEMNKERGLQNNTILALGQDFKGNIWLCLDNGISMVEFNSPISYIQNYYDIGTGYASARYGENVYLGTNQGLFYVKWTDLISPLKSNNNFHLIEGTEGQVWNLSIIDNTLFCGHNNGVFQISGNKAVKISDKQGAWTFLQLDNPGFILVGSYSGLSILEKIGEIWRFRNNIKGFDESSRFLQKDNFGNIWVGHSYKGIFKLIMNKDYSGISNLDLFDSKNGLPSVQSNFLYKLQSDILVASTDGIYQFNYKTKIFEKEKKINSYLDKNQPVDYVYQDSDNNIWYYSAHKLGVLRLQEDGSYKNIQSPFQKLDHLNLYSFKHISEMGPENVLFGIEGGFVNYSSKYTKANAVNCNIFINSIQSGDTSEGIYRYHSKNTSQALIPKFKYKNNTISISYAANNFEIPENYFQYKLLGFDENWSEWTTKKYKDYTNLPEGEYTFLLRSRNYGNSDPSELSYKFIISPPFYRAWYAWFFYLICLLGGVFVARKYVLYRIEKSRLVEKRKQQEKYLIREQKLREDALHAENEMEKLRAEKLHLEMIHKEKELANSTMQLIRKNNILSKLKTELHKATSNTSDPQTKANINSISKRIDKEMDSENQWQVFNSHVDQVYEDLFRKLKEKYPSLSPRELSLCAYLRMNISSKEIATLMNISARGVEISRYRVRKKLGLDRMANLTDFIMTL